MRDTDTRLYVHLVWATWDRLPLLTPEIERAVYACLGQECDALGASLIAVGGVSDHVHMIVRLPSAVSVAELVKQLKGSSSHLVTHRLPGGKAFKWQGRYGAFSLGEAEVEACRRYIADQKRRHGYGIEDEDPWAVGT